MLFFCRVFSAVMLFSVIGLSKGWAAAQTPPATITRQPVAVTAELGERVALSVAYTSTTDATFQWRLNKKPIRGADRRVYVVGAILPKDAGNYDVVITNAGGTTISRTVEIAVYLAPKTLPTDTVLDGDFTFQILGESMKSDGFYLVTGKETMRDPEAPADRYTYVYKRQSKTTASLVITGKFYDDEFGGYIKTQETHTLTFTGVTEAGEVRARSKVSGVFTLPAGYRPSKIGFTGTGKVLFYAASEDSAGIGPADRLDSGGSDITVQPSN